MTSDSAGVGSAANSGAADGRTVISVWVPVYPIMLDYADQMQVLGDRFSAAHPEFRVEVEGIGYLDLPGAIHRAALAGEAPTVAQYFYTSAQEAKDTKNADGRPQFTSVERAIGGRTEVLGQPVVLDDVVPGVLGYYTYDGAVAAMPLLTSTTLMYANTTLLAAAGVSEIPRTWAEVQAACVAVARLRGDGPGHSITWPNHGWMFQQSVAQQGGLLTDHDNGRSGRAQRVDLASPELLAYAQWWRRLHRDGHYLYLYNGTEVDWDGNFRAFADQQVALTLTTSVEAHRMVAAGRDGGFTVRAAPMPYNDDVPRAGNVIGGDALWLSDGLAEHTRDGALAFVQYLCEPRNVVDRHRSTNFIPLTRTAVDLLTEEGWFEEHPDFRVAIEQIGSTTGSPGARGALVGEFAAIQQICTRAMHDVLVYDADPKSRFTEATDEAQSLLDRYDAYCRGLAPRGHIRVG